MKTNKKINKLIEKFNLETNERKRERLIEKVGEYGEIFKFMIKKQEILTELTRIQHSKALNHGLITYREREMTKEINKNYLPEFHYWNKQDEQRLDDLKVREKILKELLTECN